MRKALLSPILAVGLMAMLVVIAQAPQVHAAPVAPNTSCNTTYWQYNSDITVRGGNSYQFEFQLYELRDKYSNIYCGKVYTRTGAIVPPNGPAWFKVYNDYYYQGNFVGETTARFNNPPKCCTSGPYFVSGNAFWASSGSFVDIVGYVQTDTGAWVSGASTRFYV